MLLAVLYGMQSLTITQWLVYTAFSKSYVWKAVVETWLELLQALCWWVNQHSGLCLDVKHPVYRQDV